MCFRLNREKDPSDWPRQFMKRWMNSFLLMVIIYRRRSKQAELCKDVPVCHVEIIGEAFETQVDSSVRVTLNSFSFHFPYHLPLLFPFASYWAAYTACCSRNRCR